MAKKFKTTRITPTSFVGTTGDADEVVFNPTEIPNAVFHNGGGSKLKSIVLIDYDDNINDALDLYFFQLGTNDMGTLGAAIDITDAELLANKCLGMISFPGVPNSNADGGDVINSRIYVKTNVDLIVQAEDLSSSIFVACVAQASTTSSLAGKELVFGFEQI